MPFSESNCRIPILAQLLSLGLVEFGIYLDYHTNFPFVGFISAFYGFAVLCALTTMITAPLVVIKNCDLQKQRFGILKVFTACLLSVALLFTIGRASQ